MSTQYSQLKCHNRLKIVLTKNNKTFHSASPWRKTSYYEPFYCIIQIPFRQLEYKISHKFSGVILIGNHKEINLLSKWIDTNLVIWAICKIWTLSFKTSGGRTERRVLQWKSEKVICLFFFDRKHISKCWIISFIGKSLYAVTRSGLLWYMGWTRFYNEIYIWFVMSCRII